MCNLMELGQSDEEEYVYYGQPGNAVRIFNIVYNIYKLKSPMIVNGMLIEKEQKYLIDFMWNKNRPNEGELHMISIVEQG